MLLQSLQQLLRVGCRSDVLGALEGRCFAAAVTVVAVAVTAALAIAVMASLAGEVGLSVAATAVASRPPSSACSATTATNAVRNTAAVPDIVEAAASLEGLVRQLGGIHTQPQVAWLPMLLR